MFASYYDTTYAARMCLVPKPLWRVNAHGSGKAGGRMLSEQDWDKITAKYRKKEHCELCGPVDGQIGGLQCHEDWEYTIDSHTSRPVARLNRLQALCSMCHDMVHGYYKASSYEQKVMALVCWLAQQNSRPVEQMLEYYESKARERDEFNAYPLSAWTFDLSYFRKEGVTHVNLGSDLKDAQGKPLIHIAGLVVPDDIAGQDITEEEFSTHGVRKDADRTRQSEAFSVWRWRMAYACVLLIMVMGGGYYSYANWNKNASVSDILSAGEEIAVQPVEIKVQDTVEKTPIHIPKPARKPVLSRKQASAGIGGVKCPIGTTRVISIGQDQLCCNASGTCNAP